MTIKLYDTTIETMEEALKYFRIWYEDREWDMWLEHTSYGDVIFVESIHNACDYSATLYTLDDVKEFVENGGLGD